MKTKIEKIKKMFAEEYPNIKNLVVEEYENKIYIDYKGKVYQGDIFNAVDREYDIITFSKLKYNALAVGLLFGNILSDSDSNFLKKYKISKRDFLLEKKILKEN